MRILEVTEASGSGTLAVVRQIADHAAHTGHEVVFAYGMRPETPDSLGTTADVRLVALPWRSRTLRDNVSAARALRRVADSFRPDIVHLHSTFAGLVGTLCLDARSPVVYTAHGWATYRGDGRLRSHAYRLAEGAVARRCDLVGAVSQSEAAQARALGARRVEVIPNGLPELDPGRLPAARVRSRPLVVGLGRIGPQRPPAPAARILAAVRDVAEVGWIGGAPGGEDVPLRELGIPVTGWLPHDEARERLADATALLHWSSADAQPLGVLEALARDVVVVASDIPANRELLGPRQVCASEMAAADLLRRVLSEPALRDDLLAEQRRTRSGHGAERMAARWLEVYERCASAPAAPRWPSVVQTPTIERSWS